MKGKSVNEEIKDNEAAIAELRTLIKWNPDTIETFKAIASGTCEGTANFMEKVAFAQSDLDILKQQIDDLKLKYEILKNKINELIRNGKN